MFIANMVASLVHLDGLESLTTVVGNVVILNNDALLHTDALLNLTEAGGVRVEYNDVLANVSGLANLVRPGPRVCVNRCSDFACARFALSREAFR